jgi:MFS family permease
LAWQSTAWVVPGLVAPLFAGWISDVLSWRWFFAGLLPLVPILVVMALPSLSNLQPPPDLEVSANRIPAALLLATGGGLLLTGLDQLDEAWGLPVTAAGAVVTVIALQRLLPRGWWWLSGGLASLVTFRLLLNSAFFGTDSFIPFAATEIHGSSKTAAGFLLVGGTLSWTVASWSQSRVRQRLSAPVMLASGAVVVAACSAAMITITRQSTPVWWAFVIWTVAGFGVGLAFTGSTMHATVLGEESGFGEVGGNLEVVDAFGFALMAGIGGAVVAAGERNGTDASSVSSTIFAMTAVVGVVCAIAALRIGRRTTAT